MLFGGITAPPTNQHSLSLTPFQLAGPFVLHPQPSPGRTTFFFHHSAMPTISPSPITTAAHRHAQRHTTKRARRQQCATMYVRQHIMQAGHGQPQNGLLLLLLLHHKGRAKAGMPWSDP